jgi:hypothetical protein
MNHCLFVTKKVVGQSRILLERLPNPGNIAVSKNSQAALEQAVLFAIASAVLILEERADGLSDGQPNCHEAYSL